VNSQQPISSRNKKHFKFRRFVWQWHRRFGVGIAVLVVLLCVTGILLNHTELLKLDDRAIKNSLILSLYGIEQPEITNFNSNNHWIAQLGNHVYFNENSIGSCEGVLVGATHLKEQQIYVAACESEILLVTDSGELVEKIGAFYQLPVPLSAVGICDGIPCLQNGSNFYVLDVSELSWESTTANEALLSQISVPPSALVEHWQQTYIGDAISLERLLLDIHSGRILGGIGVFIMDVSAILLCLLVISGVWLWLKTISPKR
jgi:hypothetical protein